MGKTEVSLPLHHPQPRGVTGTQSTSILSYLHKMGLLCGAGVECLNTHGTYRSQVLPASFLNQWRVFDLFSEHADP